MNWADRRGVIGEATDMKRIVIWGLGEEFLTWRKMLESGLGGEIVAYCDRNPEKREIIHNIIAPSQIYVYQPDIILTSRKIKNDIEEQKKKNGCEAVEVMEFTQFIQKHLNVHEKAVGNGMNLYKYCREIMHRTEFCVSSIMEIGANYGQDAEFLRLFWGVDNNHVYTFEANSKISKEIDKRYQYHNYNVAVSDYVGKAQLNIVSENDENSGLSTVKNYSYAAGWDKEEIDCITMESFLELHKEISTIDFLKVDAEGLHYEVLKGFGKYLEKVQIIQTEAENLLEYEGEHYLFNDIARLLMDYGFELVMYDLGKIQSDSLWIKRDLLKKGNY